MERPNEEKLALQTLGDRLENARANNGKKFVVFEEQRKLCYCSLVQQSEMEGGQRLVHLCEMKEGQRLLY